MTVGQSDNEQSDSRQSDNEQETGDRETGDSVQISRFTVCPFYGHGRLTLTTNDELLTH
jgi:hypothetical protein